MNSLLETFWPCLRIDDLQGLKGIAYLDCQDFLPRLVQLLRMCQIASASNLVSETSINVAQLTPISLLLARLPSALRSQHRALSY